MPLMLETSHSPIGPSKPSRQSPFVDDFRHASTALLSLCLDCGENAVVEWDGAGSSTLGQGRNSRAEFYILGGL